ncbi:muconolactone Delta-isomerase family protein [Amycolatopsis sp. NBC_01480]|jgi:muconolactone delta-isomerase|uniref:muconolactone Delta-isomerase family protein n=1 Tax=Amycolatopsis sp. NBC_01480 TaxID=2903562 RepID=UPI002E29D1BB|nr:muconolactone Delta-isomerase family protein [Amycolatopsis sp. NBC_01480]
MEFLVDMVTTVPEGITAETVADTKRREAERAAELAAQGRLLRLWKPPEAPGEWRTLGLYDAADEDELQQVLASMPLHKWMAVTITPFTPHPSDPGRG